MLHSRLERVQSLLQTELAQIIDRELDNPLIPRFVTVYQVKISKDLGTALVLITFLQDTTPEVIQRTITELNKSAGYIGRLIAKRVELRRHPHLHFAYNGSTRYALDIEHLFQQIKREPPKREPDEA